MECEKSSALGTAVSWVFGLNIKIFIFHDYFQLFSSSVLVLMVDCITYVSGFR
jgi:hypothetical protein